jgi:hypothetical protein
VPHAQVASGKLQLSTYAQHRLDKLKSIVEDPDQGKFDPSMFGTGSDRQQQLFDLIEAKEQSKRTPTGAPTPSATDPKTILKTYFMTKYNLDATQAGTVYDQVQEFIDNIPLTITVKGDKWFGRTGKSKYLGRTKYLYPGKVDPEQTKFRPATQKAKDKVPVADLFEKPGAKGKMEYTGKYDDPDYADERGEKYLSFRRWKDARQTKNLGFEAQDLPTFGAANINWEKNFGLLGNPGENYYGNVHFLLKKNNIKNKVVYTATDHGRPHRDPMFALADFVSGERLTKDQQPEKAEVLANMVNAALMSRDFRMELVFEIQIFGGVDIQNDVEKIYVAPNSSKVVKENIKRFSKKFNVPYTVYELPDEKTMEFSPGKQVSIVVENLQTIV